MLILCHRPVRSPHSGRDIDPKTLESGLLSTGVGTGLTNRLVHGTMNLVGRKNSDGEKVFDLDALSKHNLIEHDASLTRSDAEVGDHAKVNQTLVVRDTRLTVHQCCDGV